MPEFRKLRSGGYRCQLLPDRLKVSNKGTIRAVERIAKTILTEDCTCLYVLSVVSAQFRLYIGNRIGSATIFL